MLRTLLSMVLLISACAADDDSSLPDGGVTPDSDGSMTDGGTNPDGLPAWCGEISTDGWCTGFNPVRFECDPIAQDCADGESCYAYFLDPNTNKPDKTPFGFRCEATGTAQPSQLCGSTYGACTEGYTCISSGQHPPKDADSAGYCREFCSEYTTCPAGANRKCFGRDNGANGPLPTQMPAGVCSTQDL